MKNRYYNTFIHKVTSIDKKEPKICISKFPSGILFDLIHYVKNHWKGGYKGVLFVKEGIRLHRRVFTNSIDAQNCVFEEQVEFYNCIFESLKIKQVSFQKGIKFEECKFEEQTEFYNCIFELLKIKQVSFQKGITFEGCKLGIRPPDDKGILGEKLPMVVFEEVIFQSDIKYFMTHCDSLYFKRCKFEEDINIDNTKIDNQVVFLDCDFYKDCDFKDIEFKGETSFKGCKFDNRYSKIDFSGCTFNTADFSNTEFLGDLDFSLREEVNGDVKGVVFKNYVDFKNSKIKNVGFKGVIFQNNVYFEEAVLENIDFSGAKFVDPERDKDTINKFQREEINFSRVKFGTVSFENTLFEKNVRFHESTFEKEADFYNTSFKKLADFYLVNFQAEQQFHLTDFLDRAIFSNVIFHKEVQFIYNKTDRNSYINFESAIFKRGLDISRSNFNCNLNFWNVMIEEKGIEEIFDHLSKNATSKELKYIDDFGEHKERAIPSVYKQVRESFRIIKNSLYTQNNRIEGLKFYEKEMETYEKEIKNIQKKKATKKRKSNKYINIIQIILLLLGIFSIPIFFYTGNKIFYWIILLSFITIFVLLFTEEKGSYDRLKKNLLNQFAIQFPFILFFVVLFISFFIKLYNQGETPFYMALPLVFYVILIFFNYYKDIIILAINKWSNSFGMNWVLGLAFTIGVGVVTYLFYIHSIIGYYGVFMLFMTIFSTIMIVSCFNKILKFKWKHLIREFKCFYNHKRFVRRIWFKSSSLQLLVYFIYLFLFCLFLCGAYKVRYFDFDISKEGVKRFVFGCLKIINIIDLKPFDKDVSIQEVSDLSYLILFIGRIFIGFGYYQTIQAFRKFGKS